MACQRCNSDRILSASAHCRDLGVFEIHGQVHDGYVPGDLGIGEDDDVSFDLCLDCGQMQGAWPLPQSKLERKANKKTKARRIPFPYHAEFSFIDRDHLSEVIEWLGEHVGQEGTDNVMYWRRGHLVVRFAEKRHQTLFCLTWL